MAAYDPERKLLFIHAYRTGGTSIRRLLGLNEPGVEQIGSPHVRARDVHAYMRDSGREREWHDAFRFGFVRNPYSWLVSTWNYVLLHPTHREHEIASQGFSHYLRWVADVGLNEDRQPLEDRHSRLVDFYHDEHGNLLATILRHEDIESEARTLARIAGLSSSDIPHLNQSRPYEQATYRDFYTPADRELVSRVWALDLDYFGYEW